MFCEKCGNQVHDDVKFCPCCGALQTGNLAVEKQPTRSGEQVLSQKTKSVKNKKMSKGKIAAIVILIFEIVIICGVFVFFNVYKPGGEEDKAGSLSSLDEANENAQLAYNAISDYFDETFHIEDSIAHGFYSGTIDVKSGSLSDVLENIVDDGYVKILFMSRDYYDTRFTLQWCGDESGDGIIGQYPVPVEEEHKNTVEFGKIYNPDSYVSSTSFKDNFYYELDDDGNVIIVGYKGSGKNVVIPEYVGSAKVVAIDEYAFSYGLDRGRDIESITIPGSVKEIGDNAFLSCNQLKSVKISEGVETIGPGAFYMCSSLKEVEIPDSVETIENAAFYLCDNLEYIEIPDSVETIGNHAFGYCDNLKEVEIEDGHRFMFKNIFICSFIFFEYLFKVIAIGVFVITIIIILLVSRHKKRKKLKAELPIKQEVLPPSAMMNTAPVEVQAKIHCPQCNAEIPPDIKFCGKCGHKL